MNDDNTSTRVENDGLDSAGADMFHPGAPSPSTSKMLRQFAKLAIPAISTNLLNFISIIVNTVIAGHMNDPVMLAVVGLANVCQAIMVLSLLMGLNAAQETLTSQAFGHGDFKLCGIYLNRGRLILVAFFIPLAIGPAFFAE